MKGISQKAQQEYKMQKYIYQLPTAEILFFDEPNETYSDRFVMVTDVSEEEMLYGEIIRDPIPRMTLETQAYQIYQNTDIEYNRSQAILKMDLERRKWLKQKAVKFNFLDVEFDGNDSERTVSAKENIKGVFDALQDLPPESVAMMFPMDWRTYDNANFTFASKEQFELFYFAFIGFRLKFEQDVNALTFQLKDQILSATNLSDIRTAESSFTLPEYEAIL